MTDNHSKNIAKPLIARAGGKLAGEVRVPGDKSISHRSLILASQCIGTIEIDGLLEGEDVLATAKALQALGVGIVKRSGGIWCVMGVGAGGLSESASVLDLGNSGTGARLLMGLVASHHFTSFFTGDASLSKRPMARVATPLERIGAKIVARQGCRLPLAVVGAKLPMPITYRLPVASAQVKSAVLLAGLGIEGDTVVIEPEPTRDHTERMLRFLGAQLDIQKQEDGALGIRLKGQPELVQPGLKLFVPGDPSSAAFLAVAGLIVPESKLLIRDICINPHRTGLYETLKEMGAKLAFKNQRSVCGEEIADLELEASTLRGITVPAGRAPSMIDEYPILAAAAAFAKGKTRMEGLAELRVKESDRLSAIVSGLTACGVKVTSGEDWMEIEGGAVKGGARVATHQDHRIAMSFLILGLASQQPVTVDDGSFIATSFPGFMELMVRLGGRITPESAEGYRPMIIAIDGPAASGKGTLARRLAEQLGYAYLDTGSLYRAVGLKLVYSDKDPNDKKAAIAAAKSIELGDLANPRLRQERIGTAASIVSAYPEVREVLLDFQRKFAASAQGAVLDGRDIGTVVCPNADIKIFMTASLEARAKRRHRELQGEGIEVVYQSVLEDLKERDERDSKRQAAPLIPAEGAIHLDTTEMDAKTVFENVLNMVLPLAEAA